MQMIFVCGWRCPAACDGELQPLTTLTHFGTAVDVTVAELRMEAFLPADEATASTFDRARPGHATVG
jgi:hypothetical protein